METSRQLAAIVFTDIVGFTKLSADNEEKAYEIIEIQRNVLKPIVIEYGGKWMKEMGDGLLLSFPSSKLAVQCAVEIQKITKSYEHLNLRIGIHQGDILEKDDDIYGDDVNIASRIEPFAAPGGIAISHKIFDDISGSPEFQTKYLGKPKLKGVKQNLKIYCIISDGLPMTKLSQVKAKIEHSYNKWLYFTVFSLIILITGYYFLFFQDNSRIEWIAVLPFQNLSNDPTQEYFVNGISDAVRMELSSNKSIKVISRRSVTALKSNNLSSIQIANELGIDGLIEGSVFKRDSIIQANVTLINAKTDQIMWQSEYNRNLNQILSLQQDIAKAVLNSINTFTGSDSKDILSTDRDVDPVAYDAYLKGRFHWYKVTPHDIAQAIDYYKLALDIDPDFAPAYVGYADAMATPAHVGWIPSYEAYPQAREALLKALEIDESLASAHDILARVRFVYDWSPSSAEKGFIRAIDLDPNYPDTRVVYSQFLSIMGRHEEAIDQATVAVNLDPLNYWFLAELANRLASAGKIDEAFVHFNTVLEKEPLSYAGNDYMWDLQYGQGNHRQALTSVINFHKAIGDQEIVAAIEKRLEKESYQETFKYIADMYVKRADSIYVSPFKAAQYYAHAGETDLALSWLEKAADARDSAIVYAKRMFVFRKIWENDRFKRILKRINLDDPVSTDI